MSPQLLLQVWEEQDKGSVRTETTGLRKSLFELAFVRDKKLSLTDEATQILLFFSL